MPKPAKKSKIPLFDVRLRSTDGDTIVLKGPPSEAAPCIFSGVVAMSVLEPIHIKKLDLKLYATLNLHWEEKLHNTKGQIFVRPYNFSKIVHCYEWDPIDLHGFLHTHDPLNASFISPQSTQGDNSVSGGFMSGKQTRSNPGSATSLRNLSSNNLRELTTANSLKHNKSATSFKSSTFLGFGSGTSASYDPPVSEAILQPGNYEFPFYTVLDGSIPESIIGHGHCTLDYKLQATMERGRFSNPIITRRLINIIRTLNADNPELSETVAVDNTWPGKVDYSISCPTKAVPIGSSMRVDLDLVPLKKGLKLGAIKIKLAEYSSFSTFNGNHTDEFILTTKHLSKITNDVEGNDIWSDDRPSDIEGVFYRSHNTVLTKDKWEVRTFLNLPASLRQMTQDCDIGSLIKIRHKLKFSIGLINPDGHVSELRATLPITLFVSPFIPIKVKTLNDFTDQFTNGNFDDTSIIPKGDVVLFKADDETSRLARSRRQSIVDDNDGDDVPLANTDTQSLLAPPNYNDRVYDRLFDPASETPRRNSEEQLQPVVPVPLPKPTEDAQVIPPPKQHKSMGATFSFADDDDDDDDDDEDGDPAPLVISGPAFNSGANMPISRVGSHSNLQTSFTTGPPVQHLSRVGSMVNTPTAVMNQATSYFNLPIASTTSSSILNVMEPPNYDDALVGDISPDVMTPFYNDSIIGSVHGDDLKMNLDALDSRLRNVHLSRLQASEAPITVKLPTSNDSSPRVSRNASTNHLGGLFSSMRQHQQQSGYDIVKTPPPLSRAASSNSIHNPKLQKTPYRPVLSPPKAAIVDHTGGSGSFVVGSPLKESNPSTPSQSRRGSSSHHDADKRKSGFFSGIRKMI